MAKKEKVEFACSSCGTIHPKWLAECPDCGAVGTLKETKVVNSTEKTKLISRSWTGNTETRKAVQFSTITPVEDKDRYSTGLEEFDRAISGGIMPTGAYLLSGEPGAGKSTILIQTACHLANQGKIVLYVSAEENLEQVKHRAERLGLNSDKLYGTLNNNVETILEEIANIQPDIVIVDSIQVLYSSTVNSSIGSVSQVQTCASALNAQSKQMKYALIIIGHITKDGAIAGPKNFEHMVDVVLKLENEGNSVYRSITASKNRFGENETGFFEMTSKGLMSIDNPSNIFLPEDEESSSGSIFVMNKGNRSILVEIQTLIEKQTYNSPKRVVSGLDANRLHIILALSGKFLNNSASFAELDVYSSVLQGIVSKTPDTDLPLLISILASVYPTPFSNKMASFGEISLAGDIRSVRLAENRVKTAYKLGFNQIILPSHNQSKELDDFQKQHPDLNLYYINHIQKLTTVLNQISKDTENEY